MLRPTFWEIAPSVSPGLTSYTRLGSSLSRRLSRRRRERRVSLASVVVGLASFAPLAAGALGSGLTSGEEETIRKRTTPKLTSATGARKRNGLGLRSVMARVMVPGGRSARPGTRRPRPAAAVAVTYARLRMIRLTGLPEPRRFGRAVVETGDEVVRIVFSGDGGTRTVEVPLAYLGSGDLEATLLRLLADLAGLGYEPSWRREAGA